MIEIEAMWLLPYIISLTFCFVAFFISSISTMLLFFGDDKAIKPVFFFWGFFWIAVFIISNFVRLI